MLIKALLLALTSCCTLTYADGLRSACDQLFTGPYQDYSTAEQFNVFGVYAPKSVEDLSHLMRTTERPIAVKGAGYSMGGQTASRQGIVVDMRNINAVVEYRSAEKVIRVQAGATWRQVQELIDGDDLSVKIMQSYNNFQVGGSLSVNAHGRYVGYGPIISSVREIKVMLATGEVVTASRTENADLFAGAIGGYPPLGIIIEATLELEENARLKRTITRIVNPDLAVAVRAAIGYFESTVEKDPAAGLFNADIYPGHDDRVDVLSYARTDDPVTNPTRLQRPAPAGLWPNLKRSLLVSLEQLTDWGKRLRVKMIRVGARAKARVVYRNFEASYDNAYLKPLADRVPWLQKFGFARRKALLQEYFIPREHLPEFVANLKNILVENKVNFSNISIRHVPKNEEAVLSWSGRDSFAVVVYYTQPYGGNRDDKLAVAREWTRRVIAEVTKVGGSFYLPYQVYATRDQFNQAYPRHDEFFALKRKYDPDVRFNNSLWDQYRLSDDTYHYRDILAAADGRVELRDYFSNIFSINDAGRFIAALEEAYDVAVAKGRDPNDRSVYDELIKVLPKHANGPVKRTIETLKAWRVQQREMARQTNEALRNLGVTAVDGYVELGSPGRYVHPLRELMPITGKVYAVNDSFSAANWVETSYGIRIPAVATVKKLRFSDYDQLPQLEVPNESVDLVSMYIGLHHCPPAKLHAFVASINRVLRTGGHFVLRDHDANDHVERMAFLAHSTYNAGLGLPYGAELIEIRNLNPLEHWKRMMTQAGFEYVGKDIVQDGDPTGNTLMTFEKIARTPDVDEAIVNSVAADGPGANLNLLPGYRRPQSNTYMTQAEWFLVDIFNELARFSAQSPWYEFPFDDFTALYDQVYQSVREFTRREGLDDDKAFAQYDDMDRQLKSGIKMMFGAMKIGAARAARAARGVDRAEVVAGQAPLRDFFGEYARFMTHTPWYQFPHRRTLRDLERATRGDSRPLRTTRISLRQARVLFTVMDGAAAVVRRGLDDEEVVPNTSFLLELNDAEPARLTEDLKIELTRLGDTHALGKTERYMPFTHAMKGLANTPARVVQVAGNTHISVLVKSESGERPNVTVPFDEVLSYQFPTAGRPGGESAHHFVLRLKVADLPDFLAAAASAHLEVVRVHDY